ncbi:Ferroxidase laccase [Rhizoctonia solani]|uniref:Ferroxidase laccase n=1 Tax=Rhizoctonia solani TaxID=456999 RepID=A0A8H7I898_9AGAM|nr:Ferroxidase laccase [Rhizoctonia solani]
MHFLRPAALGALASFFGLVVSQTTTTTTSAAASTTTATATVTAVASQLTLSSDFVITDVPVTRTYEWTVATATGSPDGYYRPMLVVNGQYPGPTIEANDGDTIIVNVQNDMSVGTTVHWHGLFQNSTPWMDGPAGITQCPIPAGSSFTYQFTVSGQYGTYWWHAHASTQLADGIHGPLIIHSPDDPLKRGVDYDEDQIVVVADWYHDTSAVITSALLSSSGYQGIAAPSPNSALINGNGIWDCATYGNSSTCFTQTPYEIQVVPNKKYRFRFINTAAHAMFWVSLDGHTMNITEADDTGIYSEANSALHRFKFHNGQRYSAIVDTSVGSVGDSYYLRAQMNTACLTTLPDDFSNTTYAIVRYVEEDGTGAGPDELRLDRCRFGSGVHRPRHLVADADRGQGRTYDVVSRGMLQTGFAVSLDSDGNLDTGFEVNSTEFVDLVYQPVLHTIAAGGTVNASNVAAVVYNTRGRAAIGRIGSRPRIAHDRSPVHGMTFWIVAEGSGSLSLEEAESVSYNTTNPIRRDTHIIPASSWAVLRFEANNPGVWFMHCHIDWHLAEGFAAVIVVQPDAVAQMTIPSANTARDPVRLDVWSTSLGRRRRSLPDVRRSRATRNVFEDKGRA